MQKISCKEKIDMIISDNYDDISSQLRNRFKQKYPQVDRCKDELICDAYATLITAPTIAQNKKDPDLITEGYVRQSLYLNVRRKAKEYGYLGHTSEYLEGSFDHYLCEGDLENEIVFNDYINKLPSDEKQMSCLLIQGYSLNEITQTKIFNTRFQTDKIYSRLKNRLERDFHVVK